MAPAGIEPATSPFDRSALSTELRGHWQRMIDCQSDNTGPQKVLQMSTFCKIPANRPVQHPLWGVESAEFDRRLSYGNTCSEVRSGPLSGGRCSSLPGRMRQVRERQGVSLDQPQDRVAEQERVVAVVPAECSLVQVGGKMLRRELVVRADHGAVEQAPYAFDRVGVKTKGKKVTIYNALRCDQCRLEVPCPTS